MKNFNFSRRDNLLACAISLCVALIFYYANPKPGDFYDYTWRIAGALLHGELGLRAKPGDWLNEMVPFGGQYYSVFPLGSVLTMVPLLLLRSFFGLTLFPAAFLSACIAAATTWFLFELTALQKNAPWRRVQLALFPTLGSWMLCNLAFAGAWQIALGFAVLGQVGALYFVLVKPKPLLAGAFFALAFGNRTEVLLVAPVFLWLMAQRNSGVHRVLEVAPNSAETFEKSVRESKNSKSVREPKDDAATKVFDDSSDSERDDDSVSENFFDRVSKAEFRRAAWQFAIFPAALGVATLLYNKARFGAFSDFGYARIPGVMLEENYRHGLFSLYAIPNNAQKMLFDGWKYVGGFPYWVPSGWGGSLLLSCPFLLLLLGFRSRDRKMTRAAWMAIFVLTCVLWLHGDPGGWQYSYRYAMILLPWLFLLITLQKPAYRVLETTLLALSIGVNIYATYLFYWTPYVTP